MGRPEFFGNVRSCICVSEMICSMQGTDSECNSHAVWHTADALIHANSRWVLDRSLHVAYPPNKYANLIAGATGLAASSPNHRFFLFIFCCCKE